MKMLQNNGGFTLVELIVVIAILAVLAGVAIPAYSGYIAKAEDASLLGELEAIERAAQSAAAMEGISLKRITVDTDGEVRVYIADGQDHNDLLFIDDLYLPPDWFREAMAERGAGFVWVSTGELSGEWHSAD